MTSFYGVFVNVDCSISIFGPRSAFAVSQARMLLGEDMETAVQFVAGAKGYKYIKRPHKTTTSIENLHLAR